MYEDQIAAGAAVLDEHYPTWLNEVDVPTLELNDCQRCVLGQLTGSYNTGTTILMNRQGVPVSETDEDEWAAEHGFITPYRRCWDTDTTQSDREMAVLTSEWKTYIVTRRENQS